MRTRRWPGIGYKDISQTPRAKRKRALRGQVSSDEDEEEEDEEIGDQDVPVIRGREVWLSAPNHITGIVDNVRFQVLDITNSDDDDVFPGELNKRKFGAMIARLYKKAGFPNAGQATGRTAMQNGYLTYKNRTRVWSVEIMAMVRACFRRHWQEFHPEGFHADGAAIKFEYVFGTGQRPLMEAAWEEEENVVNADTVAGDEIDDESGLGE